MLTGVPPESLTIRSAVPLDAEACRGIYAHYVENTTATFETEVPSVEEMAARISDAQRAHDWLVLLAGGQVIGYAYAHAFHPRAAYAWACEASVYLAADRVGRGSGRLLYQRLFAGLEERGFRQVVALITSPNHASVGLHASFGFVESGRLHQVGWKHDRWLDVIFMERSLGAGDSRPPEPLR